MNKRNKILYNQGHKAAMLGKPKRCCPFGFSSMLEHIHWLAGWHDWHIENKTGIME